MRAVIQAVEETFSYMGITCADVNAMASGPDFDCDPLCAQAPARSNMRKCRVPP